MDTQESKHVFGPAVSSGRLSANSLAIYGCGKPITDPSSNNSSTVTSVTSTTGSDEDHMSANQRRSPFSSDSSELDACMPLPSGLVNEVSTRRTSHASNDSQPLKPNTSMVATSNTSTSKSVKKKESRPKAPAGLGTMSPCDHCKIAQQQRTCSFHSEAVSWKQDSGNERRTSNTADTAHVAARKETSIAVQRSNVAGASADKPNKDDRSNRKVKSAGAHSGRAHAQASSSDRLPLHRILNDPRVYYVVAFAGLAALMVVSGTGIALAARRRRRRRYRNSFVSGLSTAKDMVSALLTTWVTYSRWFRRLLFK